MPRLGFGLAGAFLMLKLRLTTSERPDSIGVEIPEGSAVVEYYSEWETVRMVLDSYGSWRVYSGPTGTPGRLIASGAVDTPPRCPNTAWAACVEANDPRKRGTCVKCGRPMPKRKVPAV